jgi:RNA-directed DNA polymerase
MAKGDSGYSKLTGGGSGAANAAFVLDMQQRKLHRWSEADPNKGFADLFNLVCDRRTLARAWQRLAGNARSRTPGTDGMTRPRLGVPLATVSRTVSELEAYLGTRLVNRSRRLTATEEY